MDIVYDMELVREAVGISRWILFRGIWGSIIAIVYAKTHPDRVIVMIFGGIFLSQGRQFRRRCERDGVSLLYS